MAEQMAFGAPFDHTSQDAAKAHKLADRILELAPHKAWKIPAEITWGENPFREPNWVAQFHMLRWLDPLRRQSRPGQKKFIDAWLSIAESWIEKNPPGRGKAQYAWADMVEAARALTFCFALPVIEELRPKHLAGIVASVQQHGDWLADPGHIRRGNHALQQHQGLLVIGAVLERDDWVELATQRSVSMLRDSYDEQGINEEGAVQYHQINFMWWRNMKRRLELISGTAPVEFDRILLAPEGMAHATRPDGRYELIGDTEEFTPRALGHPAIDYVSSGGVSGTPPGDRVKVYGAGYIFGRSGWGEEGEPFPETSFYSLRFGPQDRIHGHVDGMALTLYADQAQLLVDSGKYAYDAKDPYRAHLLAREAHNSLAVAGVDYDKTAVVALTHQQITEEGTEHFRFEDPGYDGVVLTRDILINTRWGLIFTLDSVRGERQETVTQWWHLDPDAGHRREDDSVFVRGARNSMRILWPAGAPQDVAVTRGTKAPIQGWFSPLWRTLLPTRVIAAQFSGSAGSLPTVVSFRNANEAHSVIETAGGPAGSRTFQIRRGDSEVFVATVRPDCATLVRGDGPENPVS